MAEVRYVVIDYSDEDYLEVGSTVGYFEFEYVAAGYVASVVSATAVLTSTSSLVTTAVKCRIGNLSETNTFSLTATALQIIPAELTAFNTITLSATPYNFTKAEASLNSAVTLTSIGVKVFGSLTAFTSTASVSVSAGKIFGAGIIINSNSTLAATALRIQPGAADFTAFNTVVSAAGRIRPAVNITALAATLTASPTKIFGASTNTFDAYSASPFPITGVHLTEDSYANGIGQLLYRDSTSYNQSQFFGDSTVIAFYTKLDAQSEGVIFSFSGDGVNRSPWAFTFNPANANNSFRVGTPYGRTWTNLPDVTNIHHYAIHFGGTNGVTLYVDGIIQNSYSGSISAPGVGWYETYPVLYLGRFRTIENFGYPGGPNDYQEVQSAWIEADLAQLWIGRPAGSGLAAPQFVRIIGYRFDTFESFGIYGNLSDNQVTTVGTNRPSGAGTDSTLSQPNFYAEFNDWTPAGTLNQIYFASYPLHGVFTLTPTAYKLVYGEASLSSAFSIIGVLGKLQPSSMQCSSAFAFSATPYTFTKASSALISVATVSANAYDFVKGTANLTSAFSLTADADETSTGVSLVLATASIAVSASVIRRTSVTMLVVATSFGDATTNQLGRCEISSAATFSATPYNFTKGTVSAQAVLSIQATARIFSPPRGTLLSGIQATLVATPLKLRIQTSLMQSSASFVVATGGALRRGSITMSAFDTVLSAGKVIEFLAENTIAVTNEQRLLRAALESTVLLVQMANGVNTITAETTDIVVPQEQGRLLAQYNSPTN